MVLGGLLLPYLVNFIVLCTLEIRKGSGSTHKSDNPYACIGQRYLWMPVYVNARPGSLEPGGCRQQSAILTYINMISKSHNELITFNYVPITLRKMIKMSRECDVINRQI